MHSCMSRRMTNKGYSLRMTCIPLDNRRRISPCTARRMMYGTGVHSRKCIRDSSLRYIVSRNSNTLARSGPYRHQRKSLCSRKNSCWHSLNSFVRSGPCMSLHRL